MRRKKSEYGASRRFAATNTIRRIFNNQTWTAISVLKDTPVTQSLTLRGIDAQALSPEKVRIGHGLSLLDILGVHRRFRWGNAGFC